MADTIPYVNEYEFFRAYDQDGGGFPDEATGTRKKPRLPTTPWILIQFRTSLVQSDEAATKLLQNRASGAAYNIDKDSEWTTVSFRVNNLNVNPMSDLYADIKRDSDVNKKGSLLFDNFFDNLSIEDNGGLLKCTMRLFDREFSRLESIILRTMVAMKASNQMFDNKGDVHQHAIQFNMGGPQNVNFRVRFGYADSIPKDRDFIDVPDDYDNEFKNRAKKEPGNNQAPAKMVMRSPWYYFQMMNCKFITSEGGLAAQVEGISVGTSILERLKLLQLFSIMRGTPKLLIASFGMDLFNASSGKIQIVDENGKIYTKGTSRSEAGKINSKYLEDESVDFKTELGITWPAYNDDQIKTMFPNTPLDFAKSKEGFDATQYRIEVAYGSEPKPQIDSNGKLNGVFKQEYMSIKALLQEICNKVPPMYSITKDNKIIEITNEEDVKAIFTSKEETITLTKTVGAEGQYVKSAFRPIPYGYAIKEMSAGLDRVIRIRFFYKRPALKTQEYIRKYTWRNSQNNLLTQFSIMSSFDFAAMNQKIVVRDNEGSNYYSSTAVNSIDSGEGSSPALIGDDLKRAELERGFSIVNNIQNGEINESTSTAQQIIFNMNNGNQFTGTLEIPGDPFYYFSDNIQPYQYAIYLDVIKDRNIYWQGLDGALDRSFLTGFYLITKITHLINSNGYKTNLEVVKFPTSSGSSVILASRVPPLHASSRFTGLSSSAV